jgi:hypothetical protein
MRLESIDFVPRPVSSLYHPPLEHGLLPMQEPALRCRREHVAQIVTHPEPAGGSLPGERTSSAWYGPCSTGPTAAGEASP